MDRSFSTQMRQLSSGDHERIMNYILRESEYNTYIIGDIESIGYNSNILCLYGPDDFLNGDYLLMRYGDDFVLYSYTGNFPAQMVTSFLLRESGHGCISGKYSTIKKIEHLLPSRKVRNTSLSCLRTIKKHIQRQEISLVTRLEPLDERLILLFYQEIDEFHEKYGHSIDEGLKKIKRNFHNGRIYGVIESGVLVAAACSTAESKFSAMITDVATRKDHRKRGLASLVVTKLCSDLLNEGRNSVCLYYDNPQAWVLYEKIGFENVGEYSVLRW